MPQKRETLAIGFYLVVNDETSELYVGSGILQERARTHERMLKDGNHFNRRLQEAYNRNPNFEFIPVVVEEFGYSREENRQLALELEQSTIDEFKGNPLLLNTALVVEKPRLGIKDSEETIRKRAAAIKKAWEEMTPERRAEVMERRKPALEKLRESNIGRQKSPEEIAKWKESRKGYTHSEDVRARIGAANAVALKGRTLPPEHRDKVVGFIQESNRSRQKKVLALGVVYDSVNDAARALNLNPGTVHHRLNSPHFPEWSYLD